MAESFASWIARVPAWGVRLTAAGYWCVLVFVLHYPEIPGAREAPPGSDKLVHLLLYGVLAVVLRWVIGRHTSACGALGKPWRRSLLSFGLVTVQALADEWTQPLTGRHNDLWDLLFDLVGAACFLAAYHILAVRHAGQPTDAATAPAC